MNSAEVEKQVTAVHEALTPYPAERAALPAQLPGTPMAVLQFALANNADIDKITKFVEWYEKREAEKAFVAALAAFHANPPKLEKNKKVNYDSSKGGTVKYKYATLDQVTTVVGAKLAEHGLSMRWRTTQDGSGKIRVTCVLQHALGHSEETALEATPDETGAKNEIQAMGSTVSYLQRYTGLPMVGLAAADDSDGITFGKAEEMLNSLASAVDVDELQERFNKWLKRARAAQDKPMMDLVIEAKNQRKTELVKMSDPVAKAKFDEFQALCEKKGLNKANRHMLLAKHTTTDAAIAELKTLPDSQSGGEESSRALPARDPATETPAEPAKKGREKRGKQVESTGAGGAPKDSPAPSPAPKEPEWGF